MSGPRSDAMEGDWLVPDWPAPPSVQALCTTRRGGVSLGRYESLNLGAHVGDESASVAENRERLQTRMAPARPVFMEQVHGTALFDIDTSAPLVASTADTASRADASSTTRRNIACTIMVADCLPVLFCDASGTRVAAAHAGWRGLAAGVLERAVDAFGGTDRLNVMAWLGPCIGPRAFEVGNDVKSAFEAIDPEAGKCFTQAATEGKWFANLSALAGQRLRRIGIEHISGNDGSDPWCTVWNPSRFFSYRRDGVTGRFAASVWLR